MKIIIKGKGSSSSVLFIATIDLWNGRDTTIVCTVHSFCMTTREWLLNFGLSVPHVAVTEEESRSSAEGNLLPHTGVQVDDT